MRIAQRLQRLACACVAAGTVVLSLPGAAGAAAWLIQRTPHLTRGYSGYLVGVSCTSSTACTAVGWYENVDTEAVGPALAERWDGKRWSILSLPASPGAAFSDVSCTSSTACTAVGGDSAGAPLAERWDGMGWSIQPIPTPSTGWLHGVSCPSGTVCTAIGDLPVRWDGTSWSIQPLPKPASLYAVSCTSPTACTAVGEGNGTSAARWDGMRWSFQSTPSPSVPSAVVTGINTALDDVSCTSSTACIAVGNYSYEEYEEYEGYSYLVGVQLTLAERWDGKRWSIQPTPNPSDSNEAELNGVSCTSRTACIAVGDDYAPGGRVTLAERWDGRRWSIQPTPNQPGSDETMLRAVSCTSPTACTAVGHHLDMFTAVPLVERLTPTTPARAKLTGIPAACVRAPFSAQVTGVGIASVSWWVDGRRIRGRTVHRETRYAASVSPTPGRHRLSARVTFLPSSHAPPRTFRKTINGCPPPSTGLG
jgi:hypothetical protein